MAAGAGWPHCEGNAACGDREPRIRGTCPTSRSERNVVIWFVALGSAIGGVARYLISELVQTRIGPSFPGGTLTVNVTGSFVLGMLIRVLATSAVSMEARAFLTIGVCGGYTTFSTFSYEAMAMVERGDHVRAAAYVTASVGLSMAAVWLGFLAARAVPAVRGAGS